MKKPSGRPLREQIAARDIIAALEQHILGQKKMSATQVTAALALLRKRMPDLMRKTLVPRKALARRKAEPTAHEDALKELE
ncbi:MAG TPA: hypothetical protein VEF76_00035, partial [Patescibacteria group bacterium]|nr:hypothetical protein [Patescibacteria group bacterium]